MLQVSSRAASALAGVRTQQGLGDHVGVRIYSSPSTDGSTAASIQLGFAEEPLTGDQIAETEGTLVFVAPEVADALDEALLDTAEDSGELILTRQNA
jgi:Fe-S cluster assembly iron-binding protein IscA